MKFYEINDPYYAVIRAKDDIDATKKYIEVVVGEESEFDEIHQEMNFIEQDEVESMLNECIRPNAEEWFDEDLIKEQVLRYLAGKSSEVVLVDGSIT